MRNRTALLGLAVSATIGLSMLTTPKAAFADPNSPDYSQPMLEQQLKQQNGPWYHSEVDIPQYASTATSPAVLGTPVTALGEVAPGQGGAMAGVGAALGATDTALSSSLGILGGRAGANGTGSAGGGFSPSATALGAEGGALGALFGR